MTTPATNPNPATGGEMLAGYDPTGHQSNILFRATNVQTDASSGLVYGDLVPSRESTDNVTLLASAAQTTTQTIDNIKTPPGARGVMVIVDTTVNAVACSNTVTINAKDPVSGKVTTLLTSAAITGVSTKFLTCYPGATTATNVTVSFPITPTYQVVVTAGNANSATYSVSAIYLV